MMLHRQHRRLGAQQVQEWLQRPAGVLAMHGGVLA